MLLKRPDSNQQDKEGEDPVSDISVLRADIHRLEIENRLLKQRLGLEKSEYPFPADPCAINSSNNILRASAQMKVILDNTEEAFIVVNTDLEIISFNKVAETKGRLLIGKIFKIGDSILDMADPQRLAKLREYYKEILGGKKKSYKYEWRSVGNTDYFFDLMYKPVFNETNEVIAIMIIARDISREEYALKELSMADYKFRSLVQHGGDLIAIINKEGIYEYVSPTSTTILGIEPDYFIGRSTFEFIHEADIPRLRANISGLQHSQQIKVAPFKFKNKQGEWRWIETILTNMFDDPAINGIISTSRDVTDMVELMETIEKNQQYYQSLFHNNPDMVYSLDLQGRFVSVNKSMLLLTGKQESELLGSSFSPFIDPRDLEHVQKHFLQSIKGFPQNYNTRVLPPSGAVMEINITSMPVIIDGKIIGTYGIAKDITEKVATEEHLQKAITDLEKIMDASLDVICTINEEGNFIQISAAAEKVWGYKPVELKQKPFSALVHPLELAKSLLAFDAIKTGTEMTDFENRYVHKDGSIVHMIWSARWDTNDNLMYCIARDATKKQQMAMAIDRERQQYADLFMHAPAFICILKGPGHIYQLVNPGYIKISGKVDLLGKAVKDVLPELNDQGFLKRLDEVFKTGVSYYGVEQTINVLRIATGKKEERIINFIYQAYRNVAEEIEGVFVFGVDVTAQVKARHQVEESEKRQRGLFMNNPMPMWLYEMKTKEFIDVNYAAIDHYGYSREEFLSMTIRDIRPDEDRERLCKIQRIQRNNSSVYRGQWKHIKKGGALIDVEITSHLVTYNNLQASLVLANDITEKLIAQEQKEFEKRNKEALINSTSDYIWSVDGSLNLIAANKAFLNYMNKITCSFMQPGDPLLLPRFPAPYLALWKKLYMRTLSGEAFSWEIYSPPTDTIDENWMDINFNPIYKGKDVTGIACFSRDITESKKSQNQLLAINAKLETAQEIAKLGYWGLDLSDDEFYCSKEIFKIFEMETNGHMNHSAFIDMIHPDDKLVYKSGISTSITDKLAHDIAYRIILNDGKIKWLRQNGNFKTGKEKEGCLEGTIQDITDRKEEEQSLRLMESVITNANDMVMVTIEDPETGKQKIMYVNEAFSRLTGHSLDEIAGQNPEILHGPETDLKELERLNDESGNLLPREAELINYKKNGEPYWVQISLVPVSDKNGAITHWISIERDITERRRQEEQKQSVEIVRQKENLQIIINTQEKERYYFGQELHDNIQQILAGCKIYIGLAHELDKGNNLLALSKKHIAEAINETRKLSHRLAPTSFKYRKLADACGALLSDFEKLGNYKVKLQTSSFDPTGLGDEIQLTIFRILQEQLNNILKHANAENIEVSIIRENENCIKFKVKDDGSGFDQGQKANGIGLSNIRNRISLYKGMMKITSTPGKGCTLEVSLSC